MATKKTAAQLRWAKRAAKVNKARRDKRKAIRATKERAQINDMREENKKLLKRRASAAVKSISDKLKPGTRLKTLARNAIKKGGKVMVGVSGGASGSGGGNSGDAAMVATHENGKWTVEGVKHAAFEQSRNNVIKVRALLTTARGKTGVEGAARDLNGIIELAKLEGRSEGRKDAAARMRSMRSMLDARIVCAFMARMTVMESSSSSGIPEAVIVSGLDVVKIMDALRSAGYSARGRHANTATDTAEEDSPMLGRPHVRNAS